MPDYELVAYHCPQCGGNVAVPDDAPNVSCSFCGVVLRVEKWKPPPPPDRPGREPPPLPFLPVRDPIETTRALGRFEVTLLRQSITESPLEAIAFVPIDDDHYGLYLARVVDDNRKPVSGPLGELALAASASLRDRSDPGLAVKAMLRALDASRAPGRLEAFAAVFDSARSEVVAIGCGVARAFVHANVEEARGITPFNDRGPLEKRQLRANPDAFANQEPLLLAAGDTVVFTGAAIGEDSPRSVFDSIDEHWGAGSHELARAVADRYWRDRVRAHDNRKPPRGDLVVMALHVRGNADLRPEVDVPLPTRTFKTKAFEVAVAPSPTAFVDFRALPGERHQLVWIEGADDGPRAAQGINALFAGTTGDNENPRRAGRENVAAHARALVLQLNDRHGKVAYWTRGWGPAFTLGTRNDRTPTHQQYDEGGDSWPREGARLVFPGTLPLTRPFAHLDALPRHWSGGKASCVYLLAREHEELATADRFLRSLVRAAARDVPSCALEGVGVVQRLRE